MDVTTLHSVTEDLAAYISEATVGDLSFPTPFRSYDLGDLLLHLLEQNARVAMEISGGTVDTSRTYAPLPLDREMLIASANLYGGGFEEEYRRTAHLMEDAFASISDRHVVRSVTGIAGTPNITELVDIQIRDVVIHTWDVTQALGIEDYEPNPAIARRILQSIQAHSGAPDRDNERIGQAVDGPSSDFDIFKQVLTLSGRRS